MLKVLTGYDCPGCGAQRALHALLHGDIAAAWGYNPALFFLIPLAMVYGSAELLGVRCRVTDWLYKPWLLWLLALGIIAWWILRNV